MKRYRSTTTEGCQGPIVDLTALYPGNRRGKGPGRRQDDLRRLEALVRLERGTPRELNVFVFVLGVILGMYVAIGAAVIAGVL